MKTQHPKDSAKCRCSIPTSVQSASNPERIIWPLCFLRRTLASYARLSHEERESKREREREERKGRKSPVVATPCRGSPRKKSSARVAIILPAPCSRFFWIASRSPAPSLQRPRPFLPRACINHETPGILSRQCETSVILAAPAPFFFLPLRHSPRALRTVMLLSSRLHSFYTAHHVLHHVNDSMQLSEDSRNAWRIQKNLF